MKALYHPNRIQQCSSSTSWIIMALEDYKGVLSSCLGMSRNTGHRGSIWRPLLHMNETSTQTLPRDEGPPSALISRPIPSRQSNGVSSLLVILTCTCSRPKRFSPTLMPHIPCRHTGNLCILARPLCLLLLFPATCLDHHLTVHLLCQQAPVLFLSLSSPTRGFLHYLLIGQRHITLLLLLDCLAYTSPRKKQNLEHC